jgi:hypothetical protein
MRFGDKALAPTASHSSHSLLIMRSFCKTQQQVTHDAASTVRCKTADVWKLPASHSAALQALVAPQQQQQQLWCYCMPHLHSILCAHQQLLLLLASNLTECDAHHLAEGQQTQQVVQLQYMLANQCMLHSWSTHLQSTGCPTSKQQAAAFAQLLPTHLHTLNLLRQTPSISLDTSTSHCTSY